MGRVRRYEIQDRIGLGGMAEVFRAIAVEKDGRRRPVVVKRILEHLSEDETYRRMFLDEAKLVAGLHHANVVELVDAGRMDKQLFLAMEYVDGGDLGRVLRTARRNEKPVPPAVALYVTREVLRALQYVHGRTTSDGRPMGLVHRDVTPGNVLLTRDGQVKLGDFGIAKATYRAGKTVPGVIKGNALYMSPEQLTGKKLDARTDVYAAGMMLYTMLAGRHPLEGLSFNEVVAATLGARLPAPSAMRKDLAGGTEELILKAVHSDPNERFLSALDFLFSLEARAKDGKLALEPAVLAEYVEDLFDEGPVPTPVPSIIARLDPLIAEEIATRSEKSPIPLSPSEEGSFFTTSGALDAALVAKVVPGEPAPESSIPVGAVAPAPEPTKEKERAKEPTPRPKKSDAKAAVPERAIWLGREGKAVSALAIDDHGRWAISSGNDPTLVCWDLVLRRKARALDGHKSAVTSLAISRDGAWAVSGGRDKSVRFWRMSDGSVTRTLDHGAWVFAVDVSPDGGQLLSAGLDAKVKIWERESGLVTTTLEGHEDCVNAAVFLPDGRRVLTGSRDKTIRLWDVTTGSQELALLGEAMDSVRAIAVSADGMRALSAGAEPTVRLWDLALGSEVHRFQGHKEPVAAVCFARDGRFAISASYDHTIRVWDTTDGSCREVLEGHSDAVLSLALSSDGGFAVSGGADGRVGLWDLRKP